MEQVLLALITGCTSVATIWVTGFFRDGRVLPPSVAAEVTSDASRHPTV